MIRHILTALVLAGMLVCFGGGCSDHSKSGEPKISGPAPKDGPPKPLGAPGINGSGPKQPVKQGPKPD